MKLQWVDIDGGKLKELGENPGPLPFCPPQTPPWSFLGTNPDLRGEKLVTDHLSYGMA
jgi:hypothetical protein